MGEFAYESLGLDVEGHVFPMFSVAVVSFFEGKDGVQVYDESVEVILGNLIDHGHDFVHKPHELVDGPTVISIINDSLHVHCWWYVRFEFWLGTSGQGDESFFRDIHFVDLLSDGGRRLSN